MHPLSALPLLFSPFFLSLSPPQCCPSTSTPRPDVERVADACTTSRVRCQAEVAHCEFLKNYSSSSLALFNLRDCILQIFKRSYSLPKKNRSHMKKSWLTVSAAAAEKKLLMCQLRLWKICSCQGSQRGIICLHVFLSSVASCVSVTSSMYSLSIFSSLIPTDRPTGWQPGRQMDRWSPLTHVDTRCQQKVLIKKKSTGIQKTKTPSINNRKIHTPRQRSVFTFVSGCCLKFQMIQALRSS